MRINEVGFTDLLLKLLIFIHNNEHKYIRKDQPLA